MDFNQLQPVLSDKYSFVGIKKNQEGIVELYLPRGFVTEDFTAYESKCKIFFLLYKVLRQFSTICNVKGYISDRDGTTKPLEKGQKITVDNQSNVLYSKLDSIDAILDAYDELKIIALASRLATSETIEYSKIHKFLHRAVYLNNGAIYIDTMTVPKQQVQHQATDIVSMYCYIYWEVKQQLDEEVHSEIKILAEDFRYKYLASKYSLFDENNYQPTIEILKDTLDAIAQYTPLKDDDFWLFYEAIELFIYGDLSKKDEGIVWGIDNFHSVWESMCLTYLVQGYNPQFILFLDTTFLSDKTIKEFEEATKVIDLTNAFSLNDKKLKPDAVLLHNNFEIKRPLQNFKLYTESWDDYGYRAKFSSDLSYFNSYYNKKWSRTNNNHYMSDFKIVHHGQEMNEVHTFHELSKHYISNAGLIVNKPLPSNFYSYWTVELDNTDEDSNKTIFSLMQYLNHIFYIAACHGISTENGFLEFIEKLNNKFTNYNRRSQPLRNCLFRDTSIEKASQLFKNFCEAKLSIVDVKYLDSKYFREEQNIRDAKERSIRKQFVYEYLLDQHIQNNLFKKLEIKSFFLLPYYYQISKKTKIDKILDGYITLNYFNFKSVSRVYIDSK